MAGRDWVADLLDVSAAQGAIDFDRVAAAEAFPGTGRRWRGVYQKVAEGEIAKDPTRVANMANARRVGMPYGVYLFCHPMGDVEKQVRNAFDALGPDMPALGFLLDIEGADKSLSSQDLVDRIRRARDASWKWFGAILMRVYSYPDFWSRRLMPAAASAKDLADLPLDWAWYGAGTPWYPTREQIPLAPEPWRAAGKGITIWQYSGNTKKVPGAWTGAVAGINGDVDRSVFCGTEDEFQFSFMGRPRPDQLLKEPDVIRPSVDLPERD